MKNKKKIIMGILLLIVLGGGYYVFTQKKHSSKTTSEAASNVETIEYTVKKTDFHSNMSFYGNTKIKNEQALTFNVSGTVSDVFVKEGDSVKKGQKLAVVASNSVYTEIEKQKLELDNQKDKLHKFVENIQDSGLKKANLDIQSSALELKEQKNNIKHLQESQQKKIAQEEMNLQESALQHKNLVAEVEKNIENLKKTDLTLANSKEAKIQELEKRKREYKEFLENFDVNMTKKINEHYTKIQNYYLNLDLEIKRLEKELKYADQFLGIREDPFDYKLYFSGDKSMYRDAAKKQFNIIYELFDKYEESFKNISNQKDIDGIIRTLKISKQFYEEYYKGLNTMVTAFQHSLPTEGFSKEVIHGYENEFVGKATSAKEKMTSLTATIDEIKTQKSVEQIKKDFEQEKKDMALKIKELELENQKQGFDRNYTSETTKNNIASERLKLEKSKNSIELAKIELQKLKEQQKDQLARAKIALQKHEIDYKKLLKDREELLDMSKNSEYKLLKNNIKQAQVSLEDIYKKLGDYKIEAPFDGVITQVDLSIGDRLTSDSKKAITLMDPDIIQIKIDVNQTDILKLQKGMFANIQFDSYPDKVFTGTLENINTMPKEMGTNSKFEGTVLLKKPKDIKIYSGLKAKIDLSLKNIKGAVVVPFTSVETDELGKKYVTRITKDGQKEKVFVELGYNDGKFYQVISGLSVGETILEIDYSNATPEKKKKDSVPQDQGGMMMESGMEYGY